MRSLQDGTMDQMVQNIVGQYSGYGQVHQKGYWDDQTLDNCLEENDTLVKTLTAAPGVKAVVPRIESFILCSAGNATKGGMVIGIDPEKEKALMGIQSKIVEGSYFSSDHEPSVIIAAGLAEYLKLKVNDTLVLLGQGYHGASAAGKYPIKGIIKMTSPDLNKTLLFLPIKEMQNMLSATGLLTSYAVVMQDSREVDQSFAWINKHIDKNRYEALDWKTMMPEVNQTVEGKQSSGVIIVLVLYMIISFGIFGTVLMMTKERQYEFGVLVSIGMGRMRLAIVTALESLIISLLGTFIGLLAALPLILYFVEYPIKVTGKLAKTYESYGMAPSLNSLFEPHVFYQQAIIIFIISIVICLYPLTSISKLKPVEAMHVD
jgi:putative ABC transport system permease protein